MTGLAIAFAAYLVMSGLVGAVGYFLARDVLRAVRRSGR